MAGGEQATRSGDQQQTLAIPLVAQRGRFDQAGHALEAPIDRARRVNSDGRHSGSTAAHRSAPRSRA